MWAFEAGAGCGVLPNPETVSVRGPGTGEGVSVTDYCRLASTETGANPTDVVQRAKQALEGVTDGPWEYDESEKTLEMFKGPVVWLGDGDLGAVLENHYQDAENGQFIAAARSLVPELVGGCTVSPVLALQEEAA